MPFTPALSAFVLPPRLCAPPQAPLDPPTLAAPPCPPPQQTAMTTVVRRTFVLGEGSSSSSSGNSSSAPASASASASHSSVVDPSTLQSSWRVPSLLTLCADALATPSLLLSTPLAYLDSLPPELLALVCSSASRRRQWTEDSVRHALPLLGQLDELSLAQCDWLRGSQLTEVCAALTRPLHSVDLSRSYHLSELGGLLRARLHQCRTLDLDRCRRLSSAELRPILRACPQLETLRLSGTRVDESTLHDLAQLAREGREGGGSNGNGNSGSGSWNHLTSLDVSSCIMSSRLDALCGSELPLADLRLSGCGFRMDQLLSISQLAPNLTRFHAQFLMHSRNELLRAVGVCTHLTELDLSRNSELGDAGFAHLTELTNLRTLNLSRTDLTRDSVGVLSKFTRLTHLDVGYNLGFDDAMLRSLAPRLPRLRVLILAYCGVTDSGVVDALLGGAGGGSESEGGAQVPAVACPSIQVLKLNGCARVGDETMQALALRAAAPMQPIEQGQQDAPLNSPSLDSPSALDSLASLESSLRSSAPRHSFPHSLLSLDFGGPAAGDACVSALGAILPSLPQLQRVGVWNSQINTSRLKRDMASWVPTPCAPPASPHAASRWELDESMKTTSGTFLFVRRSMHDQTRLQQERQERQAFMYDLDDFAASVEAKRRAERRKNGIGKSVRFAEGQSLCTFYDPPPEQPPEEEQLQQVEPEPSPSRRRVVIPWRQRSASSENKTES